MINIQEHLSTDKIINEVDLVLKLIPYINTKQDIVLTSQGEGMCFDTMGLYNFLDKLTDHYDYSKNKITLESWNLLEKHNDYKINIKNEIYDIHYFNNPIDITKPNNYNIGVFNSRADFLRMYFHSKIQNVSWRDRLIYSFRHDLYKDPWPNGITKYIDKGLSYSLLKETLPYSDLNHAVTLPIVPPNNIFDLKKTYRDIVLEIVFETAWKKGFFVTEKTLRPIYYGKPFILIGSPNFERNMEKLGFNLNFNIPLDIYKYHSYDKLNKSFDLIENWFLKINLEKWIESIQDILTHNQKVLKTYVNNYGHIDLDIIKQLI